MAGKDDTTPGSATTGASDETRDATAPGTTAAATQRIPAQDSPPRRGRAGRDDTAPTSPEHDKSLGQLIASATRDLSALIRGEISLAKAELKQSAAAVGKGAGMFAAAAVLAFVAVLMLSTAAAFGLMAAGLHPAVGFVVVGGAWLLLTAVIAYLGMRSVRKARAPQRTLHSLEEARGIVSRGHEVPRSRTSPETPRSPDGK